VLSGRKPNPKLGIKDLIINAMNLTEGVSTEAELVYGLNLSLGVKNEYSQIDEKSTSKLTDQITQL
jgi:hypothetical protein